MALLVVVVVVMVVVGLLVPAGMALMKVEAALTFAGALFWL